MWRIGSVACASALLACAPAPGPAAPDRATQQAACVSAVAAHLGLPPGAVTSGWRSTAPDGVALFEVRDGGRMHTCEADAGGRVLRIEHPASGG